MATLPELFARQIGTVDVIGDVLLDNLAEELAAAIKYSADQPRVPAGTPGGGQFAPADGGGIAGAGGTPPQHPTEFVPGVGGQPFIPGMTPPGHEPPTPPSPPSAPTPQTTPPPTPTARGRPPA